MRLGEEKEIAVWTEHEDKLVDQIVDSWNKIVVQAENQTIKFAVILNEMISTYPEETAKEIIKRVKEHPNIRSSMSVDRIYQGWRLVKNRPDLPKYILEYTPEQLAALPEDQKPILKKDGYVAVEHYFELYKRPHLIDEGLKTYMEMEAKKNQWTVAQLKKKIDEATLELKEPFEKVRLEKKNQIARAIVLLRMLDVEELKETIDFINKLISNRIEEVKQREKA
jgi:hypothetical protein